jgi:hypothetical protein
MQEQMTHLQFSITNYQLQLLTEWPEPKNNSPGTES